MEKKEGREVPRDNYLAVIQQKTGKSVAELAEMAETKGYGGIDVKPALVMAWIKEEFHLGHGHAMALMHAIKGIHSPSNG